MLSYLFDDKLVDFVVKRKEKYYLMHHSFEFYPDAIDMIDYLKNRSNWLFSVEQVSNDCEKRF